MQSQIDVKNKRHSSLLSSSINNNSLDIEKSKDNLNGYSNDKQFNENDIFNSSISKEILSFSLDMNKNISNNGNTEENALLNKNLKKENINLNSQKESNCSSVSSSYSNNNTVIMEKSSSTIKINDENGKKYKISQNLINNSDDNFINKESRLSYLSNNESSINKSPAIMDFSKDINDLSNNSINSDVSLNNQSKVRLSKQGSTTTISSNVTNGITNNEDTLLELSVNSLELLGSYLKNSSSENLVQGLQNLSLCEENSYISKKFSENSIEYYNKKASSIILPYLKLNEFIEDQEISETIASISKGWPVEKSGFILRKMIYSNGVYKNMTNTNNQDKKVKSEIPIVTDDKESKNSNQGKRKGKHKKSQSHDSNRHSNDFPYPSTNSNSGASELKNSKDWDWILYYAELRGQYLFFYRLYNNDPYWKKDSHNKYKGKPGTLENIRNVFVERIISFGRNKKNSSHGHTSSNNNNNSNRNNNVTNNNSKNNINDNNVLYKSKIHDKHQSSDNDQQHQQKLADKITSEQKNNINPTQKQKSKSVQDNNQSKRTLQQQLLASQNIHPRDTNNKNSSSSVSRSFTFANITSANYKKYSYGGKSSIDSNISLNSNTEVNLNSPVMQSGLPPHPIYSTSFSNRQSINNSSSPGLSSPSFSSPYPSPLNTNFSAFKNSSTSQLTPNSLNSSNDIDYAPLIVPTVLTNNNSKSNSYPQMNMKGHSESSNSISTMKNAYTESETEMIKDGMSEMDSIIPPQMITEDGISSSIISSSGITQINSPKEINDIETSLINTTSETFETRIITTNVTSQIVNDYIDIKKPLEDGKTLNSEISKISTQQNMVTTSVTTTKTTSTISTSSTSSISVIGENSEQKILSSPNRVDSLSNLITEQKIMSSPNRVDSLSNLSTSNKFNHNRSTSSSVSPSLSMIGRQTSIDSSNGYKMKRKSKIHELHTSPAIDNINDYSRNKTSYLQSDIENSVSNENSMNNGQNRSLQESTNSKKINELSLPNRRSSNSNYIPSANSPYLNDSVNNKYKNNISSPQLYNINESNTMSSLPPTTPLNGNSSNYGGKSHNNHINYSKHSSIQKQKYHGKIVGKPIMTLDDVNGPLDVLRAQRVLVHYIPLNYSVVEQLTYNERSSSINGIISNEIPLLLLTYVNQDKDFSSACQVLFQVTNIGLGITNTPKTSSVSKIVSSSLRTPKQESINSDAYYISSPLIRQRQSQNQGSPVLTSSQIPSNFSILASNNGSKTPVLTESCERENHLIENEINDWSRHIQQSSSVLENPSINYSSLGYGRFSHEDVSPQILWNEERQNINYNNFIPKSVSYGGTSNSSINIKNLDGMNSTILPSSVHSIPSITTINTHQNLSSNIKQEINSATSNRSFFSDIAPTFYEGNSTSFALESFTENNQIPLINSTISLNEPSTIKEESGIEINRKSKHNEFNQSFISHSLPYNYKTLEITRTSPFISSPSTRSLDDDRIVLPIEEGMSGTEKSSSPYPLVTDISEIKPSDGLKVTFHNDLSSSSSLTTLISQDSVKSKQSKLNAISEESFGKEPLANDREFYSFEVVKTKDKELGEGSTSVILPKTPSMIYEEASSMLSSEIVNNNVNSPNSNSSSTKMINFDGNKSKSINSLTNDSIKNSSSVYKGMTSQNNNSNSSIIPPQKPQKSIKRIKENNELKASQNNSKSDNLYVDVNNLIPSRKTNTFIKNKRNQLKLKMNIENSGSPLKTYENIPSPVQSISSLRSNSNEDCSNNSNSNLVLSTPIQKQPLFMPKAKQGKEHIKYPRRESLKQHLIVMTLDKGQSKSSINQGPLSAPPYMDMYNNELKDDYKMQSVVKDSNMKKSSFTKIKEKIHEKPTRPNKENVFENQLSPRRTSLKDNIIFDGGKYRKEKEVNELNKKLSKEMEKKQLKEKEALKKKSKKEAKREKKEKKNEEKLEKQEKKHQEKLEKLNINKLKISSPKPLTDDEINSLNSPKSTSRKEKFKKGWYQIALSKLPTKSLNSQNKKNNLFSDFKKGDTNTEILIKRTPTCSSHTSVRRRVVSSNRASICTNSTNNTVSTQASIPFASQKDSLPEVPAILMKCIKLIEEYGLETEGLYRISGNSSNVQNLLKLFNHEPDKIQLLPPGSEPQKSSSRKTFKSSSNIPPPSSNLYKDSKYLYDNDIHVVTGCIKLWLRNGIPPNNEPLWPYHMYDDLIKASQIKDYTTRMISFQDLVHALPPMNFATLNFLFEHLFKVSTFSEQNKMTISNLAIIFGPTLLKSPPNSKENEIMIITRMPFQCKAVEILIEQYEWLFGPIEYEEESIDEEELGKELINSSFHEIQNQLQGEIKDNEVVILKNNSNKNDIDVMVSTTDKMVFPINNLEINKNDIIDISMTSNDDKEKKNELEQSDNNNSLNFDFKITEENNDDCEELDEDTECNNSASRNENNYFKFDKDDYEYKTQDSHEEGYKRNRDSFDLSLVEKGNKINERKNLELNRIKEGKESEYLKSLNIESIQLMKKVSEEYYELIKDDDESERSSKENKKKDNKDKSKIKIKNSSSSNRLKQLLSRPNKSKKIDDLNLSHSDIKSLISSPITNQHNTSSISKEEDKLILDHMNKNKNPLNFNNEKNIKIISSNHENIGYEIEFNIPKNDIYEKLSENKKDQIYREPSGIDDFSEKTLANQNNNSESNHPKKKGKELSQKVSNSSMRIFQEQFLMDGFENDIESSLNDYLSTQIDDENSSLGDDKDNIIKKKSIIKLSTQKTAKLNLELEKHLEQIYKDKKGNKLIINKDHEDNDEKIKKQ